MCAKLMLMAKSTLITLSIHGKLLQNLTNTKTDSEVTEEGLLSLPPLKEVIYDERNVITSFKFT